MTELSAARKKIDLARAQLRDAVNSNQWRDAQLDAVHATLRWSEDAYNLYFGAVRSRNSEQVRQFKRLVENQMWQLSEQAMNVVCVGCCRQDTAILAKQAEVAERVRKAVTLAVEATREHCYAALRSMS